MSVLGEVIGSLLEGLVELVFHLADAAVDPVRKRYGWLAATVMVLSLLAILIGLVVLAFYWWA